MTGNQLARGVLAAAWSLMALALAGCDASASFTGAGRTLGQPGAAASPSEAALIGRVVSVADGDTLTLLVDQREVRVRLAEIDAPERGPALGGALQGSAPIPCPGPDGSRG